MNIIEIRNALDTLPIPSHRIHLIAQLKDNIDLLIDAMTNQYPEEALEGLNCLQTPGDLGELSILIEEYPKENNLNCLVYDLERALGILEMMELSYDLYLSTPTMLSNIPGFKVFKKKYPNLYETFEVWIWS